MLNHTEIGNRGSIVSGVAGVSAQSSDDARQQVKAEITADVYNMMRKAVVKAIGTTSATDDIVNDAIVRMLAKADSFDWTKGTVLNWGCRIAANLARNWRKASANRGHISTGLDADGNEQDLTDLMVGANGLHEAERASDAAALASALDSLTVDERRFCEDIQSGMTQTEAGALHGWSPATACRRMKAIAAKLAPLYY